MSQDDVYVNNGGTALAISSDDFCIIAGDTRLSKGYSILSRNCSRMIELTPKCILTTSGMQSDIVTLQKVLKYKIKWYRHQHGKWPATPAVAQLLSTILYQRRMFPYYTFNVLSGFDAGGKGHVYSYDAVGSFGVSSFSCVGSGQPLIQPLFDNQIGLQNQEYPDEESKPKVTLEKMVEFVKVVFSSAAERDIFTGDAAEIYIMTRDGTRKETIALRDD